MEILSNPSTSFTSQDSLEFDLDNFFDFDLALSGEPIDEHAPKDEIDLSILDLSSQFLFDQIDPNGPTLDINKIFSSNETSPEIPIFEERPTMKTIAKRSRYNSKSIVRPRARSASPVSRRPCQRNKVVITHHTSKLPPALPSMNSFRYLNGYSLDHFLVGCCQPEGSYNYEANDRVESIYSPRVFRYLKSDEPLKRERARGIAPREGLCPFCVSQNTDLLFHDMNTSQYSIHLMNYHGVFTTGRPVEDPVNHCYGLELKKNGAKREVECVRCPYIGCDEVIKLSPKKSHGTDQQRFAGYLRHVCQKHKDRKNKRSGSI